MILKMNLWLLIIGLTIVSGIGDAFGFIYAARVWQDGRLIYSALAKSAMGYVFGISIYWYIVKLLQQKDIFSPELQTLSWFIVTIVCIALISRKIFTWPVREQIVAVIAIGCIAWLLYHVE